MRNPIIIVVFLWTVGVANLNSQWVQGNLEIHHINIGRADATLVISPTGKTLLIDCGETNKDSHSNADTVGAYIERIIGKKQIDYLLITNFNIGKVGVVGKGGLWHLIEHLRFKFDKILHRDYLTKIGKESESFTQWKEYLEINRFILHSDFAKTGTEQIDLGPDMIVDIKIVDAGPYLSVGNHSSDPNPPSENDYSIGIVIKYGLFDEWIGGDLSGKFFVSDSGFSYHDIETPTSVLVGDVDVYKVNNHGNESSSNNTFLGQLSPEVSIISTGKNSPKDYPSQIVLDMADPA